MLYLETQNNHETFEGIPNVNGRALSNKMYFSRNVVYNIMKSYSRRQSFLLAASAYVTFKAL